MKCPQCQADISDDSRFCSKCGTPVQAAERIVFSQTRTILRPMEEMAPETLLAGKYRIIKVIGRGGMGIVYEAEDTKLKRHVALKFLPPELVLSPEARERFVLEARAAASLSHTNICTIYEIHDEGEKPFIAMEYIEGLSLKKRIAKGAPSPEEAVDLAVQVAEGLEEAHKKGIIHRDIKSANIMVTDKGQAKIMDFGLAKVTGGTLLTREGTTLGTVAYMSPEQALGKEVDQRADIWSLGIVLYELLSGKLPFHGDHEASILYTVVHEEPKPLKTVKPDVAPELQQVVNRALKKHPEARYSSAVEMGKDLLKFRDSLKAEAAKAFSLRALLRSLRRPIVAVPTVIALITIVLAAVWFFNRQAKIRWARDVALPEIDRLIEGGYQNYFRAYDLAVQAEKVIPKDSQLTGLLSGCSVKIDVLTNPPGAAVFIKPYVSPDSEWTYLGDSPIKERRVARSFFRFRIEKEGYEPVDCYRTTFLLDIEKGTRAPLVSIDIPLDKAGTIPPGMVRVQGTEGIGDFFIDWFEVTNKQYKEFVDAGGYRKREYWKHKFIRDDRQLSWEDAVAEFVDQTGRPGPSTWEAGEYKKGQELYPVNGVSWYEAAAYAEFAGKNLPTVDHWYIATGMNVYTRLVMHALLPLSNFGTEGPAAVGSHPGMVVSGAYDMAGNVREWCWNESQKGRSIRGGAWNDAIYMFMAVTQAPPFDRSTRNGFRCARYIEPEKIPDAIFEPTKLDEGRDFYQEKPVSDEIFKVYKEQFAYDPHDLKAIVEKREEGPSWITEKVSFDASYANERMIVWLFLPKNATPPYQTVIYFPGSDATWYDSSEIIEGSRSVDFFNFIVANGRAVLYPIYKGTFERKKGFEDSRTLHGGDESHRYVEYLVQVVKDFKRAIDYLQSRKDIDSGRLAFMGTSWGGRLGNIIPAVEERLGASIIVIGGLSEEQKKRPEADEINYVTRVKVPTLMLNGKYDVHAFPYEMAVKPMYDLVGTAKEDKQLILFETDHFIPRNELIKYTLAWLDKYLGPVK
ncbi:MAG: protein kinase [Candidatus Aminicenantes bacterium]|nr:protein kinase [Candidatus Aminicenantes bacterium]